MRRHFRYIFLALILCISTVSCIEELDAPQIMQENEELTLVPRVKSFTNQYVTKSAYTGNETKIDTLSLLVFDSDGKLVHLHEGEGELVTINKSMLNSPDKKEGLASATVVMFANISIDKICDAGGKSIIANKEVLTLDDMKNYTYHWERGKTFVTDLGDNFTGFPMVGGIKEVDLTATRPQQAPIEVALKILYAKINFSIAVAPGTENEGTGMNFQLKGYTVNNVSKATVLKDLNIEGEETGTVDESSEATASADYDFTSSAASGTATGTADLNGQTVGFTFYVAESRYNHNSDLKGIYPDDNWLAGNDDEDVKGWSSMSEAEKEKNIPNGVKYFYDDLIQQYKPKLAEVDGGKPGKGLATYVTLNGTYTDYRGTVWDVNYKVYLGKDNAHNFHVDRNSEYTNYITIKGIRNNGSYGEGQVWVDHRVDVSLNSDSPNEGADCVTITRETLIDSHIEVRPLRVKFTTSDYIAAVIYLPKYPLDEQGKIIYDCTTEPSSWGQVTEVKGDSNENWIAIENNDGKYNKGKLYCPNGKRKYFTTSLIEELHLDNNAEENGILTDDSGNKFIPLKEDDCAWIYFDENGTVDRRRAQIDVVFYTSTGATTTETFDIYQSGLEEYGGIQFETYEEYLHSYDSEDQYSLDTSPTDYTQQGLDWGVLVDNNSDGILEGSQLSENYIVKSIAGGEDFVNNRYDYGHINDFPDYVTRVKSGTDWVNVDLTKNTGFWFTYKASEKVGMTVIDMGTRPESAYQYCLSKNKFYEDPDGEEHKMAIHWYLPDVYEMKTILQYEGSSDFNSGAYYWSSQPSYTTSVLGGIVSENDEYARIVSSESDTPVDSHRSNQHRIRCAYDKTGEEADMTDRVPNGLGGIIRIPMKAYETYPTVKGYFGNWLNEFEENPKDTPSRPDYSFPKGTDAYTFEHIAINNKIYYIDDPLTKWYYSYITESDNTLYHYPGLSKKEVVKETYTSRYTESTNDKKYERTESTIKGEKIESLPSNEDLIPLDYLDKTDSLTISFNRGSNPSKMLSYSYRREDSNHTITYTQYWDTPQYDSTSVKEDSGYERTIEVSWSIYNDYDVTNRKNTYDIGDQYVYENVTYEITNRRSTFSWQEGYTYYFDLGPTTIDQECFEYVEGTGGWSNPSVYDTYPDNPVVDKLEMFGGNTFTITAKEGYVIQSIKVNYSGSNSVHTSTYIGGDGGASDNRFLRLVETRPTTSNEPPKNMSYSGDGDTGWFKWAAASDNEDVSSVTLNLVTYTVTESFGLGGVTWWDSSFSYIEPADATGYESDFNTSIIIDSFEIRIAKMTIDQ